MKIYGYTLVTLELFISVLSKLLPNYNKHCLSSIDRTNLTRNIFEGNDKIIIESTRRSSHRIVSHIISILIRERLGYKISCRDVDWDNATETVNRLACNNNSCEGSKPESHINMEVWMPPGFTSSEWVNRNLIVDCGPLGPSAKTGIFFYNHENYSIPIHDWRKIQENSRRNNSDFYQKKTIYRHYQIFGNCNDSTSTLCRTKFAIDFELPSHHARIMDRLYNNWKIETILSDEQTNFYFTWYPNAFTIQNKLSRILFPDCNFGELKFPNFHCEDSVNQLAKIIWIGIKTKAPLIYDLIDSFQLTQEDFTGFLKQVNLSSINIEQEYYEIACHWIHNHRALWEPLTIGWNTSHHLYIIILLPNTESNMSDKENAALEHSITMLNTNVSYFGSYQYQLQIKFTIVNCDKPDIIQDYLKSVSFAIKRNSNPIIGILSGLPTYCMDEIYRITNAQKKIMVSFRHEIFPILSRHGNNPALNIPYVFQTMPSKETYYCLLLKIAKYYQWHYLTIITDNDDYKSGLNSSVIHKERIYRNNRIDEIHFKKFLRHNLDELNAKIFILDFDSNEIFKVLCLAGKLQMTLSNGFVWIINRYLADELILQSFMRCKDEIKSITNNYFYLSPFSELALKQSKINSYSLYRAVVFLGKIAYLALTKDPSINDYNADVLMNYTRNEELVENFCSGNLLDYNSIKMDQNSLFWKIWCFYKINGSKISPLLDFEIQEKVHILDPYQFHMRKLMSWEMPKDGKLNEKCLVEFLSKILNIKCINAEILVLIIFSLIILLVLILGFVISYKKKAKKIYDPMKRAFQDLMQDLLDIDIHSSKLNLNHIIGRGAFGMVYGGEASNAKGVLEAVAVKTISENSDWVEKIDFFTEAKVMRKLRHPNIVELIGVCLENENNLIFLIMELMVEGDLRNYLLSRRSNAAMYPENSIESIELCKRLNSFAKDVAEGLYYMHSKYMVHRDIACRNCLISHDFKVKLGDFGLTRYLSPPCNTGIYKFEGNLSLPVRWMPPEGIQFGLFSIKSDIWSFGILLFEIVTFGVCPYQDFSNSQNIDLMDRIKRNQLSITDYLPQSARDSVVRRLMNKCCSFNSNDRPESMSQIIQVLLSENACIRPYLTEDPPKFEGDKNLDNLSVNHPGIVIEEEELQFTSPSEMHLNSSQKCINIINRAFGIKSFSVKERTDLFVRKLRPCQSSLSISRNQLSTEEFESLKMKKSIDLFAGSIPTDLCNNMGFQKKSRTSTRSISNFFKISPKTSNYKMKIFSKDFQ